MATPRKGDMKRMRRPMGRRHPTGGALSAETDVRRTQGVSYPIVIGKRYDVSVMRC